MEAEVDAMAQRPLAGHIKRRGGYLAMALRDIAKAATLAGVLAVKRVSELRRSAAVN